MSGKTSPCDACHEPIDPSLTACPHCGNEPSKAAKRSAYILIAVGIGLSITVIGAVIGVPLILLGIGVLVVVHTGMADYSPTKYSFDAPF